MEMDAAAFWWLIVHAGAQIYLSEEMKGEFDSKTITLLQS